MTFVEKFRTNYWIQCVLNSYSLIFFSNDNLFAICIIVVSFFTPFVGMCGLVSIVLINLTAYFIGFDKDEIKSGLFGFNALFLGMAIGYEFNFGKITLETRYVFFFGVSNEFLLFKSPAKSMRHSLVLSIGYSLKN